MLITIWFIIIVLMVVAGIVLRLIPRTLPPVQLHKVAPRAASRLVSDFIASSYETDFGYPSGYFRIERTTETEVGGTGGARGQGRDRPPSQRWRIRMQMPAMDQSVARTSMSHPVRKLQ